jgi:hypothetical protein
MARLTEEEKAEFLRAASEPPWENPPLPPLPFEEFLRSISTLPPGLSPEKPVRFVGEHWKL